MAVAALRVALDSERSRLQQIDASIKKIVQNPPASRPIHQDRLSLNSSDSGRGSFGGRLAGGGGEDGGKRRHETKTVFSRLSGRHDGDSDAEEWGGGAGGAAKKPRLSSHVTRDLPSKQEVMKAQCGDEQSKVRNRRMFGSLLGTLHKFKQEELVLKSKEEKRAKVEKRIEQQEQREKDQLRRERQTLFAERELKKATIKSLEAKMARVAEYEVWAECQKVLVNFIQTIAQPPLYWRPRIMDSRAQLKVDASATLHTEFMQKKKQQLEEELILIEQRCMRSCKNQNMTKENQQEGEREQQETEDKPMTEASSSPPPPTADHQQHSPRNGDTTPSPHAPIDNKENNNINSETPTGEELHSQEMEDIKSET